MEYHTALTAVVNDWPEYKNAVIGPDRHLWLEAMNEELRSLSKNETWTLVEKPKSAKVLTNRWVLQVKRKANGDIDKYKARPVVRGFTQRAGVDFEETFSPVIRFESIRTVLAVAVELKLELRQFDIKTAFLYGHLEEDLYMNQPEGFTDGTERVCKLHRAIYGLRQASRCWNIRFTEFLKKHQLNTIPPTRIGCVSCSSTVFKQSSSR